VNLQQLHTLIVVSEQESIRSAARILNLSQPAVTRNMRELEKSVGAPLLRRGTKGVELIAYGLALLRRAHIILEQTKRAQDELDQMQDGSGGTLNIAITSTAAVAILPTALQRFRRLMPRVDLAISEASHSNVQDRLQSG
jgi:DNA-binding transcriptional LysR family regulator